jgi:F-type H+-transporting ATPase subunit a
MCFASSRRKTREAANDNERPDFLDAAEMKGRRRPDRAMNPTEQFELQRIAPYFVNGVDVSFTNASLYMLLAAAAAIILTLFTTFKRALVPGRGQALAETLYEFVAHTVRSTAGKEGMRFFPFVFTLFTFILMSNLIGLVPYTYSLSSQIVITFAFAAFVITLVILYGLFRHGLGFLRLFVPHGVPAPVLVILIPIEIISFLSRPVSLSVRLFANILAGHITLAVFGGLAVMLLGAGSWAALAPVPVLGVVVLYALELLVNCLQAFVFAVLTCVYLNDAIHPGH